SMLLLVYLLNAFTLFNGAKYDWLSFFSNANRLWLAGLWMFGTIGVLFDIGYYFYWYRKAKKMVQSEQECPEPRLYRPIVRIFIILLGVLFICLMSS
ncbi:MAG: hypothetical protein IJ274_11955, partial [Lachnospiraceae bacterium]|nr:hypothetical protein [Lachnospiraceae bacterium]